MRLVLDTNKYRQIKRDGDHFVILTLFLPQYFNVDKNNNPNRASWMDWICPCVKVVVCPCQHYLNWAKLLWYKFDFC